MSGTQGHAACQGACQRWQQKEAPAQLAGGCTPAPAPSPLLQVPAERGNAPRPGAAARHLSTPLMQLPQPPPLAHALQRAARICHAGISLLRLLPRVLYLLPLPLQVGQDCRARGLPGRKRWSIARRVSRLARSTEPQLAATRTRRSLLCAKHGRQVPGRARCCAR